MTESGKIAGDMPGGARKAATPALAPGPYSPLLFTLSFRRRASVGVVRQRHHRAFVACKPRDQAHFDHLGLQRRNERVARCLESAATGVSRPKRDRGA